MTTYREFTKQEKMNMIVELARDLLVHNVPGLGKDIDSVKLCTRDAYNIAQDWMDLADTEHPPGGYRHEKEDMKIEAQQVEPQQDDAGKHKKMQSVEEVRKGADARIRKEWLSDIQVPGMPTKSEYKHMYGPRPVLRLEHDGIYARLEHVGGTSQDYMFNYTMIVGVNNPEVMWETRANQLSQLLAWLLSEPSDHLTIPSRKTRQYFAEKIAIFKDGVKGSGS